MEKEKNIMNMINYYLKVNILKEKEMEISLLIPPLLFHQTNPYNSKLIEKCAFLLVFCPNLKKLSLSRHHLTADLSNRIYCQICTDLAAMIFNNLKKDICADLKVLGAAADLLTTLIEAYGIFNDSVHHESYVTQRNMQILQYIQDHYREKIKIADVAASAGLHPQYFSSYFKNQFSTLVFDFIVDCFNFYIVFPVYSNINFRIIVLDVKYSGSEITVSKCEE